MDEQLLLRVLNIDDSKLLTMLDKEIEKLQLARQELLARMNGHGHLEYATRHAQLVAFLRQHGPSPIKDILKGTGMPRGSAGFIVNRALANGQLTRLDDGRYQLPHENNTCLPSQPQMDWDEGGRIHNWKNHVGENVRAIWHTLSDVQRAAVKADAENKAADEDWD